MLHRTAVITFGLLAVSAAANAQELWKTERHIIHSWENVTGRETQAYSPLHKLGASSLAFDAADGSLYLACEKHPALLRFERGREQPRLVRLKIPADLDIEALSIHENVMYMCDEDRLMIYSFPLNRPADVTAIPAMRLGVDRAGSPENGTDLRSVEGLVVTSKLLGTSAGVRRQAEGPFFYLLDEQDRQGGAYVARIYIAFRDGNELKRVQEPVSFALRDRYERLTDLFIFNGDLYAIRSYFSRASSSYSIVRCDLRSRILTDVFEFTSVAVAAAHSGKSSNFEGATVVDGGRLMIVSDNEQEVTGIGDHPGEGKQPTALVEFVTAK